MIAHGGAGSAHPAPTPEAPERRAVTAMFDRIAARYDLLNRLLSAGSDVRWRRAAVESLALPAGARLLDLCTGTGDVLLEWHRRDARNRGVGLDGSAAMLACARRKLTRVRADERVQLVEGDALDLPFAASSFDGALIAFGLRNVDRRERVLEEVARVLRVGAPFVVLEFGNPAGILGRLYGAYFRRILPRVGGWLSRDGSAYAYLPASVLSFPRPSELVRFMEAAGFAGVSASPLTFGIAWVHRGVRR
jgi:demethylmenaquinone methyltransferase/2-methoxy-6-polyprenyl-1,4-benzoquinol methylase